jgi:hypothetical protein
VTDETKATANAAYALGQLAKAFLASSSHEDPAARERARVKVEAWAKVFQGMLTGALGVGSRTPVANTPGWATLEVVRGGFATGELAAAGALRPHEAGLLDRLALEGAGHERAALNAHFLTEAGLGQLLALLRSGCYRVDVPEEAALLVVAWLVERGHADTARAVLDEIGPFLRTLRFYPVPAEEPVLATSLVHVQSVGDTVRQLEAIRTRRTALAQRETLLVWHPLLDRFVALFAETVEGAPPSLRAGPDGDPLRVDGKWTIDGGWPCQLWPPGWRTRANAALRDFTALHAEHKRSGRPEEETGNFAVLHGLLGRCAKDPKKLTGREVGIIRGTLARIAWKRGLPGSERCRELRAAQARVAALPTRRELAGVVVARLAAFPRDGGVPALEPMLAPVGDDEAARHGVPSGSATFEALRARLARSLDAPVAWLVDEGVIPSGEVLARVIPQITSQVGAAGIADPDLRRLYGAIYAAFRRRRSLLLLNLASQVKLEELPWMRAIEGFRSRKGAGRDVARRTLEEVVSIALLAWPQTILPNKLLQEVRALAKGAALTLPIVDEVAADIFMGEFTEKYLHAAQRAAGLLRGSIYETYYGIDFERVARIDDVPKKSGSAAPVSQGFVALCHARAGASRERSWGSKGGVAENGRVIEQEQILTTHNLAVLIDGLELREAFARRAPDLARRCFEWVCSHLETDFGSAWRARLHALKNSAYAWRQMVFFLSLAQKTEVEGFLAWAADHLGARPAAFQARFRPVLAGLVRAAGGETPGDDPAARVFLGWTNGKHWILGSTDQGAPA